MVRYCEWLMDRDRKSPGLKLVQGLTWERGYQAGELRGVVYPDVAPAMRQWKEAGLLVAIYSSGSELSQRRLFESVADGDLTPLISAFFDTAVGAKTDPASYRRIVAALLGLLRYEPRRDEPLIDLRFFRSAPFSGATVIAVSAFAALGGFLFLSTLYLQNVRGLDALHAGLWMLPMAFLCFVCAPVAGRLVGSRGPRLPARGGSRRR